MRLKDDGKNSFSRNYSVCVIDGKEVAVTDLIGLKSDLYAEPELSIQKEEKNGFPLYLILIIFIFAVLSLLLAKLLRKGLNRK